MGWRLDYNLVWHKLCLGSSAFQPEPWSLVKKMFRYTAVVSHGHNQIWKLDPTTLVPVDPHATVPASTKAGHEGSQRITGSLCDRASRTMTAVNTSLSCLAFKTAPQPAACNYSGCMSQNSLRYATTSRSAQKSKTCHFIQPMCIHVSQHLCTWQSSDQQKDVSEHIT